MEMEQLEKHIQNIKRGHLQGLSQSLWFMDTTYAETQLSGILQYPDIQYVTITSKVQQSNLSAGTGQTENILSYDFPLVHSANERDYDVGNLHIVVNLNNVYQRLFKKIVVILGTQALRTFMVSGFIFFIVQWLITRHLVNISNHIQALSTNNLGQSLQLPKSVKERNELSQVVTALNRMGKNLQEKIKSLQRSESKYLDLYDSAPDMYVSVEAKTATIIQCNQTLCNKTGYTKEEVIGQPIFSMYHSGCMEKVKDVFQTFTETGEVYNTELKIRQKDGTSIDVMLNASAVRDPQGQILYSRSSWRDITDKKKIEEESKKLEIRLRQQQKIDSIGQLAGGIAHDFNNMLSPILGFTEIAMEELPKTHRVQEDLKDIFNSAKRARDLVKRILLFSRQKEQVLEPLQLRPVIEESLKIVRSSIPANIDLKKELINEGGYVLSDSTEIHEIVLNLCTNAYQSFEGKSGTIKVSLSKIVPHKNLKLPAGDYLCLGVKDNGMGIAPENIDKIFEPYFTTKDIGKGTGLGLSVVHGIVRNYKGDIHIESTPGKGTTINVFLPVTSPATSYESPQDLERKLEGSEKILLVDDEQSIVKYGIRALENKGYTVTGVVDPFEALSLFQSNPDDYDLVITDMAMPGMVGSKLAQKLLAIRSNIPIIICSGYSEKLDSPEVAEINIRAFVDKPILVKELIGKIRAILD